MIEIMCIYFIQIAISTASYGCLGTEEIAVGSYYTGKHHGEDGSVNFQTNNKFKVDLVAVTKVRVIDPFIIICDIS